jgi:7-dehydrocholesterol reductase
MSVYNFKFFLWETGYFNSMDIQHDRAGYYICWGCLVWVPAVYASPALYVASVAPAVTLGRDVSALIAVLGLLSIWINYDSDVQRQEFRASGGKTLVWGKQPQIVTAEYKVMKHGKWETKKSLLLASGWWGLARHFHCTYWGFPKSRHRPFDALYAVRLRKSYHYNTCTRVHDCSARLL